MSNDAGGEDQETTTCLAVITARGGSKGVPRKNVRALAGKPLIAWTIEAALHAGYIDRVIVSTDDAEIADVSRQVGAEVPFVRPSPLSSDLARQEDAVLHAMDWVEKGSGPLGIIMMLAPTNPIRGATEIDRVVSEFLACPRAKAMMTVVPCEHSPLQANTLPPDGSMAGFLSDEVHLKNRQELPQFFRICGSVCIAYWDHFRRHESFVTDDTFASITTPESGWDIDSELDFVLAETVLKMTL